MTIYNQLFFILYYSFYKKYIYYIMGLISWFISFVYDLFISRLLTLWTYAYWVCRSYGLSVLWGCLGCGVFTRYALKRVINNMPPGTKVVGIDINPKYIQTAKHNFKKYDNVQVEQISIL